MEPQDYPFYNWSDYFAALTHSIATYDFGKQYPMYEHIIKAKNEHDVAIVHDMIKQGHDVQEGLDGLAQAVIDGAKHLDGLPLAKMVALLVHNGAKPDADKLFTAMSNIQTHIDDETNAYRARAQLIDIFSIYGIDVTKYTDWVNVRAQNWNNVPLDLMRSGDYIDMHYSSLKYHSKYLQKFNN